MSSITIDSLTRSGTCGKATVGIKGLTDNLCHEKMMTNVRGKCDLSLQTFTNRIPDILLSSDFLLYIADPE